MKAKYLNKLLKIFNLVAANFKNRNNNKNNIISNVKVILNKSKGQINNKLLQKN